MEYPYNVIFIIFITLSLSLAIILWSKREQENRLREIERQDLFQKEKRRLYLIEEERRKAIQAQNKLNKECDEYINSLGLDNFLYPENFGDKIQYALFHGTLEVPYRQTTKNHPVSVRFFKDYVLFDGKDYVLFDGFDTFNLKVKYKTIVSAFKEKTNMQVYNAISFAISNGKNYRFIIQAPTSANPLKSIKLMYLLLGHGKLNQIEKLAKK